MIQPHNEGEMPSLSCTLCSLLLKFLVILLKVIHLKMWTSSRPDIKQQRLNLTTLYSLITLENGPFILLTWNRDAQRGNKRFNRSKGKKEMWWWNMSWCLKYSDNDSSKQRFHCISTAGILFMCVFVCLWWGVCNGEPI